MAKQFKRGIVHSFYVCDLPEAKGHIFRAGKDPFAIRAPGKGIYGSAMSNESSGINVFYISYIPESANYNQDLR